MARGETKLDIMPGIGHIFRRGGILFLLSCMLLLGGCSARRIKDIKLQRCTIESLTPVGLHAIKAQLALDVENPAMRFTLEDVEGLIMYQGTPIVRFVADPFTIMGRTTAVYSVPCNANLVEGVSLMNLMSIASRSSLSDFTTDIHAKVKLKGGARKSFDFKDVPVDRLLKN